MAKSTKARGATFTEHELTDPNPPPRVHRAMLGGEPKSAGTDLSESSESDKKLNGPEKVNRQEPAQTTGNLLNQTGTEDSTVDSTDGSGQETVTESDNYSDWSYRELQTECKERELPASGTQDELIKRLLKSDEDMSEEDDFA